MNVECSILLANSAEFVRNFVSQDPITYSNYLKKEKKIMKNIISNIKRITMNILTPKL
jgi:hypothetical protein